MDFSLKTYEKIIYEFLQSGFSIKPLSDAVEHSPDKLTAYLRHDVDYSLSAALEVARINYSLGVQGCFFLLPRHRLYNLAAENNMLRVSEITNLKQKIGLHFVIQKSKKYMSPPSIIDLMPTINEEFELLKQLIDVRVEPALSWHNPSDQGSEFAKTIGVDIPGILNAYELSSRGISYMADTNLRYSAQEWLDAARVSNSSIQLCFHPEVWAFSGNTMEEILAECWKDIISEMEPAFLDNRVYNKILPNGLSTEFARNFTLPLTTSKHK